MMPYSSYDGLELEMCSRYDTDVFQICGAGSCDARLSLRVVLIML